MCNEIEWFYGDRKQQKTDFINGREIQPSDRLPKGKLATSE